MDGRWRRVLYVRGRCEVERVQQAVGLPRVGCRGGVDLVARCSGYFGPFPSDRRPDVRGSRRRVYLFRGLPCPFLGCGGGWRLAGRLGCVLFARCEGQGQEYQCGVFHGPTSYGSRPWGPRYPAPASIPVPLVLIGIDPVSESFPPWGRWGDRCERTSWGAKLVIIERTFQAGRGPPIGWCL